jgi:tetratricopeptide (TPR) repeat protein
MNKGRKKSRPSEKPAAAQPARSLGLGQIAVVFGISCIAYSNTLANGFVYDDLYGMLKRTSWSSSLLSLPAALLNRIWQQSSSNYYRPMIGVLNRTGYLISGLSPWGFHLLNVLLHAGVSVLVYVLAARLITERKSGGAMHTDNTSLFSIAFIAAVLFAVFPVHTESVAWVSGITDPSYTFFFLLSLVLYIEPGMVASALSLVFFFIAALCKEPALTLPLLIVAFDYSTDRISSGPAARAALKRYLPYIAVGLIYLALRVHSLHGFAPAWISHRELGTHAQAATAFQLFSAYLWKLLFPVDLSAYYLLHPVKSLHDSAAILSLLVAAAFLAGSAACFRRQRVAFFSLLLIAVPLLPVLYIRAIGESSFAERYLYLPSAGAAILAALLLKSLKTGKAKKAEAAFVLFACLSLVFLIGTVSRNAVWKDDYSLWADTVLKSPDAETPRYNLANVLAHEGRLREAIQEYQAVLRLDPGHAKAHNNLGIAYAMSGLRDNAIDEFRASLGIDPDNANAHYNLGNAYGEKRMWDKAVEQYTSALAINPRYAEAHNNLGQAYRAKGMPRLAVEHFKAAVSLNPSNPVFKRNLDALTGTPHISDGRSRTE